MGNAEYMGSQIKNKPSKIAQPHIYITSPNMTPRITKLSLIIVLIGLLGIALGKSQILNNNSGDLNKKKSHGRRRLQSYLAYAQTPMYAQPSTGYVSNPEMPVDQRQLVLTNSAQQPVVQQLPMQFAQQTQVLPTNQAVNFGQAVGNDGFMRNLTTTINGLNSAIENYNRELTSPVIQNTYQNQQNNLQQAPINLPLPQQNPAMDPRQMVQQTQMPIQPQQMMDPRQMVQQTQMPQGQMLAQQPQMPQAQIYAQQPQMVDPRQMTLQQQQQQYSQIGQTVVQQPQVQNLQTQPVVQPKPQAARPAPRQAALAKGPITLLSAGGRLFPQVNGRSMSLITEVEPPKSMGNQIQF